MNSGYTAKLSELRAKGVSTVALRHIALELLVCVVTLLSRWRGCWVVARVIKVRKWTRPLTFWFFYQKTLASRTCALITSLMHPQIQARWLRVTKLYFTRQPKSLSLSFDQKVDRWSFPYQRLAALISSRKSIGFKICSVSRQYKVLDTVTSDSPGRRYCTVPIKLQCRATTKVNEKIWSTI